MTDIAVVANNVGVSDSLFNTRIQAIAAASITKGQLLYWTTSGTVNLADGSAAGTAQVCGLALNAAGAGQAVDVLVEGIVDGFTVTGLAYGARVYLSDTAGAFADAAGTVSVTLGRIIAASDAAKTKLIHFSALGWLNTQYT